MLFIILVYITFLSPHRHRKQQGAHIVQLAPAHCVVDNNNP